MPKGRSRCPGPEGSPCGGDGFKPNNRDLCFTCRPRPGCVDCGGPTSKTQTLRCPKCAARFRGPRVHAPGPDRKPPGVCARCNTPQRPEAMTPVSLEETPKGGASRDIYLCPDCWRVEHGIRMTRAHGGL